MKISIFSGERSSVTSIPAEITADDGKVYGCVIEIRTTSVGGAEINETEVIWEEDAPSQKEQVEKEILALLEKEDQACGC